MTPRLLILLTLALSGCGSAKNPVISSGNPSASARGNPSSSGKISELPKIQATSDNVPLFLSSDLNDIEIQTFDARLERAAKLVGVPSTHAALEGMRAAKDSLGGFDFAAGKAWDGSWNSSRIQQCQLAAALFCTSEVFKQKWAGIGADPRNFLTASFGKSSLAPELKSIETALAGLGNIASERKDLLVCSAVICSVEFNARGISSETSGGKYGLLLRRVLPVLVGRSPTNAELVATAGADVAGLRAFWLNLFEESTLAPLAVRRYQAQWRLSGHDGTIDYNLAGNFVQKVISEKLPWSQILTAEKCYSPSGQDIACDSGSPVNSGVLTSRGFLSQYKGRYNLKRARAMLNFFACTDYPMSIKTEPPFPKEHFIPMFKASSQADQQVKEAANGFGNGAACYTCHSQFGPHSQLFVKFNANGQYTAAASGSQDPSGALGESFGKLYASHFVTPDRASSESSVFFGKNAANISEAANTLVRSREFARCTTRQILVQALGISTERLNAVPESWYDSLILSLNKPFEQATYQEIMANVFSNPAFKSE